MEIWNKLNYNEEYAIKNFSFTKLYGLNIKNVSLETSFLSIAFLLKKFILKDLYSIYICKHA